MQKVEIVLNGDQAEECADLIMRLANETIKYFDVQMTSSYCGKAAVKKGFADLIVPAWVNGKS